MASAAASCALRRRSAGDHTRRSLAAQSDRPHPGPPQPRARYVRRVTQIVGVRGRATGQLAASIDFLHLATHWAASHLPDHSERVRQALARANMKRTGALPTEGDLLRVELAALGRHAFLGGDRGGFKSETKRLRSGN